MPNARTEDHIRCLVVAIADFLRDQLQTRSDFLPEDRDCLEIAIQCLETAYDLESEVHLRYRPSRPLEDIFRQFANPVPVQSKLRADSLKDEGNSSMRQGRFQRAELEYSRAIELDPWNAVYYCNRASARIELQLYFEAIADCRMALHLNPDYAKAHARMGQAYAMLRRPREAARCFRQALELEPNNERHRNNLQVAESQIPRQSAEGLFGSLLGSLFGVGAQSSGRQPDPSSFVIIAESHPATVFQSSESSGTDPASLGSRHRQRRGSIEAGNNHRDQPILIQFPSLHGIVEGSDDERAVGEGPVQTAEGGGRRTSTVQAYREQFSAFQLLVRSFYEEVDGALVDISKGVKEKVDKLGSQGASKSGYSCFIDRVDKVKKRAADAHDNVKKCLEEDVGFGTLTRAVEAARDQILASLDEVSLCMEDADNGSKTESGKSDESVLDAYRKASEAILEKLSEAQKAIYIAIVDLSSELEGYELSSDAYAAVHLNKLSCKVRGLVAEMEESLEKSLEDALRDSSGGHSEEYLENYTKDSLNVELWNAEQSLEEEFDIVKDSLLQAMQLEDSSVLNMLEEAKQDTLKQIRDLSELIDERLNELDFKELDSNDEFESSGEDDQRLGLHDAKDGFSKIREKIVEVKESVEKVCSNMRITITRNPEIAKKNLTVLASKTATKVKSEIAKTEKTLKEALEEAKKDIRSSENKTSESSDQRIQRCITTIQNEMEAMKMAVIQNYIWLKEDAAPLLGEDVDKILKDAAADLEKAMKDALESTGCILEKAKSEMEDPSCEKCERLSRLFAQLNKDINGQFEDIVSSYDSACKKVQDGIQPSSNIKTDPTVAQREKTNDCLEAGTTKCPKNTEADSSSSSDAGPSREQPTEKDPGGISEGKD